MKHRSVDVYAQERTGRRRRATFVLVCVLLTAAADGYAEEPGTNSATASQGPTLFDRLPTRSRSSDEPITLTAVLGEPQLPEDDLHVWFCLAISNDGHRLAFHRPDVVRGSKSQNELRLVEVTGEELRERRLPLGSTRAKEFAFSPDGKRLAAAVEKSVRIWNLEELELKPATTLSVSVAAQTLAFSPCGRWLAVGRHDMSIHCYDLFSTSLAVVESHPADPGTFSRMRDLDFSPDGKLLAAGFYDRTVKVWDFEMGRLRERASVLHKAYASGVRFSAAGRHVITGVGGSPVPLLWNIDGRPQSEIQFEPFQDKALFCIAVSRDGRRLAGSNLKNRVAVWNATTGKKNCEYEMENVRDVALSPDGRYLLVAKSDATVEVYDTDPAELR